MVNPKIKEKERRVFKRIAEERPRHVQPEWSVDEMLGKPGLFYLEDVAGKLHLSPAELKKMAANLQSEGKSSWKVMGIRRNWNDWIVKMQLFGEYFRQHPPDHVRRVQQKWDANDLLSQSGLFALNEVCKKLPFTIQQIRYKVKNNENSQEEYGVWRDPQTNSYLVQMEVFSRWIRNIWSNFRVSS